jgi:Protein of unknown function (DUF1573)
MRHRVALPFFVTLLSIATAVVAEPAPKAVPLDPIKDFNVVARGELIIHDFLIKNEGDAVLMLDDVHPACGCTVVNYDQKIEPGKIGKISAKVETVDFAGPISKSIAVFTNDKTNPKLQLVVKADVKPYVGVTPGYARFSYVQNETLRPITQTIWAEDGKDFNVVAVKAPGDHIKASFRAAKAEERKKDQQGNELIGKQWIVDVELSPTAPVGALKDFVEVETDHPKQKQVRLPVSGFVRPRQHITPFELDFGSLEGATLPLQRSLTMTSFITDVIQIPKIETGVAGLTAEVKSNEKQPGHRFMLTLTLGPEMPKGVFDTVVKVHTTDAKNPIVSLPVKGEVK